MDIKEARERLSIRTDALTEALDDRAGFLETRETRIQQMFVPFHPESLKWMAGTTVELVKSLVEVARCAPTCIRNKLENEG